MNFPLSWFDVVVVILIGFGVFRGRKRGMSEEALSVLQWLLIVYIASAVYEPVGKALSQTTSVFSLLSCYVTVYIAVAIAIKIIFTMIQRAVGEKLVGSDVFGQSEYYLGMVAGALRFACMIILFLALLHARTVTAQEKAENAKRQQENFGSISFPTLGSIQDEIFGRAYSGQFVKKNLSQLLIKETVSEKKSLTTESIGRRRERSVDEVMGGPSRK